MGGPGDEKTCASCGRRMEWRKAWAKNWDEVRYCSAACRKRKVRAVDRELEAAILGLLDQRAGGATICPSEAAKLVGSPDWRELMEPARCAAAGWWQPARSSSPKRVVWSTPPPLKGRFAFGCSSRTVLRVAISGDPQRSRIRIRPLPQGKRTRTRWFALLINHSYMDVYLSLLDSSIHL